jgi:hypothetical protein
MGRGAMSIIKGIIFPLVARCKLEADASLKPPNRTAGHQAAAATAGRIMPKNPASAHSEGICRMSRLCQNTA